MKLPLDIFSGVDGEGDLSSSVTNMYLVVEGDKRYLRSIEGNTSYHNTGLDGLISRCIYKASDGSLYFARGTYVFVSKVITGIRTQFKIATIGNSYNPIEMADNGSDVVFCDGISLYRHSIGSYTVAEIIEADDIKNPKHVGFLNGRLITNVTSGVLEERGRIFWSDIYDASTWSALSYANAEGNNDPLISFKIVNGNIWMLGSESIECWTGTDSDNLPFSRVSNTMNNIGISAEYSAQVIEDRCYFIGSGKSGEAGVYRTSGYSIEKISTPTISKYLKDNDYTNAKCYSYNYNGHTFYLINLPDAKSLCYCIENGAWHFRSSIDSQYKEIGYQLNNHEFYDGMVLAFYGNTGEIVEISDAYYRDYNDLEIVKEVESKSVRNDGESFIVKKLSLLMDTGLVQYESDNDSLVFMEYSHDGGYTWSNKSSYNIGRTGQYAKDISWRTLGLCPEFSTRFTTSVDSKVVIYGANIDI